MFSTIGTLIYDPPRPGMKDQDWWCIVDVDKEITRYFRSWVVRYPAYFGETKINLCEPSWNAHISVIRGHEPVHKELWKKYDGEKIDLKYSVEIRRTGKYTDGNDSFFFIDAYSDRLKEIRKELFPDDTHSNKFHITIGRIW